MRKPVLNGNTDTIQRVGTGCFQSNLVLDCSPKRNAGVSKFSQFVNNEETKESMESGTGGENSPSRRMKSGMSELHKKALINNYNKESSTSPLKKNLETIPDEDSRVKSNWENKMGGVDPKKKNFE